MKQTKYTNISKLYTKYKDKINWEKDNQSNIYKKLIKETRQETTFKQHNALMRPKFTK